MATRWYRDGTITVTNGSRDVVGVGTKWVDAANKPLAGDAIKVSHQIYEIESITDNTNLKLLKPFNGIAGSDLEYAIMRNASINISTRLAASVAAAINSHQQYLDEINALFTSNADTIIMHNAIGDPVTIIPYNALTSQISQLVQDAGTIAQTVAEAKTARDEAQQAAQTTTQHANEVATKAQEVATAVGEAKTARDEAKAAEQATKTAASMANGWLYHCRNKADLERMIQVNENQFACSGFVDMGNHSNSKDKVYAPINEGLFCGSNVANRLLMGHLFGSHEGTSKTAFPRTNIAGFISDLYGISNAPSSGHINVIKLPEAPDGTDVWDSSGDVRGSGKAVLNLKTDIDPKYGDAPTGTAAEIQREAVGRAFEGSFIRNGDLRNGDTEWSHTADVSIDTDGIHFPATPSYCQQFPTGNVVEVDDVDYKVSFVADTAGITIQFYIYGKSSNTDGRIDVVTVEGLNEFAFPFSSRNQSFGNNNGVYLGNTGQVTLSNISVKPVTEEVVTDRVDMYGGEFFLEEVTKANPFFYAKGMVQGKAATINGVATTRSNRPESYYTWFEGDSGSEGDSVDFWAATDSQRVAFVSDHSNNLFNIGDDLIPKIVQWRMRGRSFAGAGNGDWEGTTSGAGIDCQYTSRLGFRDIAYLTAQGVNDTVATWHYSTNSATTLFGREYPRQSWLTTHETGVFKVGDTSNLAVNGEAYFHEWGTVLRLNKGGYVESINESGTANINSNHTGANGDKWHNSNALTPVTRSECFHGVDASTDTTSRGYALGTGGIGEVNGREDGRFYDAIYEGGQGGVSDDRLTAWDIGSPEEAAKIDAKVKSDNYRGKERLVRTQIQEFFDYHNNTTSSTFTKAGDCFAEINDAYGWYGYRLRFGISGTTAVSTSSFNGRSDDGNVGDRFHSYAVYVGDNGNTFVARGVIHFAFTGATHYFTPVGGYEDKETERDAFNATFPDGTVITVYVVHADYSNISVEGDFSCKTIMGLPQNIIQIPELRNGWTGYFCHELPDTNNKYMPLVRESVTLAGGDIAIIATNDNGAAWYTRTGSQWGYGIANNALLVSMARETVAIVNFTAKAYVTEKDKNRVVLNGRAGIGNVWASLYYGHNNNYGVSFIESLIHKNVTATTGSAKLFGEYGLISAPIETDQDMMMHSVNYYPTHEHIDLDAPNNLTNITAKTLMYQTAENQACYLNYAFEEMAYTNGAFNPWGDDRKMVIVANGNQIGTDTNEVSVLQGTNRLVKRYGYTKNKARAGVQVKGVDL